MTVIHTKFKKKQFNTKDSSFVQIETNDAFWSAVQYVNPFIALLHDVHEYMLAIYCNIAVLKSTDLASTFLVCLVFIGTNCVLQRSHQHKVEQITQHFWLLYNLWVPPLATLVVVSTMNFETVAGWLWKKFGYTLLFIHALEGTREPALPIIAKLKPRLSKVYKDLHGSGGYKLEEQWYFIGILEFWWEMIFLQYVEGFSLMYDRIS